MISIQNRPITANELKEFFSDAKDREIIDWMANSHKVYRYESLNELKFEILFRRKTIEASLDLLKSKAQFATFENSYCHDHFWQLSSKGAFLLKKDVTPAKGIEDIFINGNKYAFECATAIVIVFYKAALDSIGEKAFNYLFADLVLYDWHYDKDLGVRTTVTTDFVPGDCVYFNNPDFNPETPQWRGVNAIHLGNNLYYGHGIGIRDAKGVIETLNRYRKRQAVESAYLKDQVTRPNYKYLSTYQNYIRENKNKRISARIGQTFYTF